MSNAIKTIKITQLRSTIGQTKKQKDTVEALKLKINKTVEHKATDPILGMIEKVKHLVHTEISK